MKQLSVFGAFIHAFRNADTKTFPNYEGRRIEPGEIAGGIRKILEAIPESAATGAGFPALLEKAKESLDEAKGQTEYQDQKVARLLTIIAFLTAAGGTIFSKAVDAYPISHDGPWNHWNLLIYASYLAFFVFVALAGSGALISFHATRTRFVWDPTQGNLVQRDKAPKSQLFFQESIRVTPENWAKSFSAVSADGNNPGLLLESYKGYVIESYLVNAKIADKLRLLEPAQALLGHAIRALLVWLLLVGILFIFVGRPLMSAAVPKDLTSAPTQSGGASAPYDRPSSVGVHIENRGSDIVVNCAPVVKPPVPTGPTGPSKRRACPTPGASVSEPKSVDVP